MHGQLNIKGPLLHTDIEWVIRNNIWNLWRQKNICFHAFIKLTKKIRKLMPSLHRFSRISLSLNKFSRLIYCADFYTTKHKITCKLTKYHVWPKVNFGLQCTEFHWTQNAQRHYIKKKSYTRFHPNRKRSRES